jgi:hypothetical protein
MSKERIDALKAELDRLDEAGEKWQGGLPRRWCVQALAWQYPILTASATQTVTSETSASIEISMTGSVENSALATKTLQSLSNFDRRDATNWHEKEREVNEQYGFLGNDGGKNCQMNHADLVARLENDPSRIICQKKGIGAVLL